MPEQQNPLSVQEQLEDLEIRHDSLQGRALKLEGEVTGLKFMVDDLQVRLAALESVLAGARTDERRREMVSAAYRARVLGGDC
jgi:hypothetical protein